MPHTALMELIMQLYSSLIDFGISTQLKGKSNIRKLILSKIALYSLRYRTRKQLQGLSMEQLRDIGISRQQVEAECRLPFWK